jgi:hypothetical protein
MSDDTRNRIENHFDHHPDEIVRRTWRKLVQISGIYLADTWLSPTGTPRRFTQSDRMIQSAKRDLLSELLSLGDVRYTDTAIKMASTETAQNLGAKKV